MDEQGGTIEIVACSGTLPDMSGSYEIARTGDAFHAALSVGEVIRIDDVAGEARMARDGLGERYRRLGIVAALVVPVISADHYRAMLFAHEARPRHWSDGEERMLREATQLIWREISRARAQTALKRSEERYRRIFEQGSAILAAISNYLCEHASACRLQNGARIPRSLRSVGRLTASETLVERFPLVHDAQFGIVIVPAITLVAVINPGVVGLVALISAAFNSLPIGRRAKHRQRRKRQNC